MPSKRRQEGYLFVDHRESPGLPPDAALMTPGKPSPLIVGRSAMLESATITCSHCQVIVILNPLRDRPRGYCAKCDAYVCDNPLCLRECHPFAKLMDDICERAIRGQEPLVVQSLPVVPDSEPIVVPSIIVP